MKNIIALLAISLLFACSSEGDAVEIGEKTTLEVNDVYDAGTVVKGEVIRAVFTVKNTGDHPLVFGEVRPSCSCTVADKPSEPIPPGASTKIIAKVNTANVSSKEVTKSVTIMTNTTPSTKVLIIKAKIK
ncbi:MAG: DUF1573 domain-containing protein [Flavobacteriales bacterium]|jgi:hypothetical protein